LQSRGGISKILSSVSALVGGLAVVFMTFMQVAEKFYFNNRPAELDAIYKDGLKVEETPSDIELSSKQVIDSSPSQHTADASSGNSELAEFEKKAADLHAEYQARLLECYKAFSQNLRNRSQNSLPPGIQIDSMSASDVNLHQFQEPSVFTPNPLAGIQVLTLFELLNMLSYPSLCFTYIILG
jgi:hypothetical protein